MDNKIKDDFLRNASNILAATKNGLTGSQIAKYFLEKGVNENIEVKHSTSTFRDNGKTITKSVALYQNLCCFNSKQQYEIIIELCNKFDDNESVLNLKRLTEERYGYLVSNKNEITPNTTNSTIPKTKELIKEESINSNPSSLISQNNMSNNDNIEIIPWYKKPKYFVQIIVAIITIIGGIIVGVFPLLQTKQTNNSLNETMHKRYIYELKLSDHLTYKTPIIKTTPARLKLYHTIPPAILPIVDGTAKFESDSLLTTPISIEFENVKNYEIFDRLHTLKVGQNEILVKKK